MSRKRLKQYLLLLLAIGVIAVAMSGGGTFAGFTAETTNPGNTFVSGTLYLHNTANGGTVCKSESATSSPNFNIENNCDILFPAVPFDGTAQTADLALDNAGSIDASDLFFKVGNCSVGANDVSSPVFGGALTCGDLFITIQQTDSSYNVPSTDVFCAYGPTTDNTDCGTPDNTATLADPTSFTSLNMDDGTGNPTAATLPSGQTNYYVITIQPGALAGNGNQWQNRKASFDLSWHIDQ
jgi:predicted ribosomally synthesized peptide with SipW-like signal peptide